MSHNEFDLHKDLFEPIRQFLVESNIVTSHVKGHVVPLKDKYFYPPKAIREMGSPHE